MATAAVLPDSLNKQRHLQKNLLTSPEDTDVNGGARGKFGEMPSTATDTRKFVKESHKLSVQSKSLFENAILKDLDESNRNHSDPNLFSSHKPNSPTVSEVEQRRKKLSLGASKLVTFTMEPEEDTASSVSSRRSSAGITEVRDNPEDEIAPGFFVPNFIKKREEALAQLKVNSKQPKIDPVLVKHREMQEQWAVASMGLQTRKKFESDQSRITEWNERKASHRPIKTMPLL